MVDQPSDRRVPGLPLRCHAEVPVDDAMSSFAPRDPIEGVPGYPKSSSHDRDLHDLGLTQPWWPSSGMAFKYQALRKHKKTPTFPFPTSRSLFLCRSPTAVGCPDDRTRIYPASMPRKWASSSLKCQPNCSTTRMLIMPKNTSWLLVFWLTSQKSARHLNQSSLFWGMKDDNNI